MSATKLELKALSLEVNNLSGGTCHSLHELVVIGYKAQAAANFVESTVTSIAPHVHELYARIEKGIRDDEKSKDWSEEEIFTECIDTIKGLLDLERVSLVKEFDWQGKGLPTAYDQAHRKVFGTWELCGSLMHHTTVSQCEKFVKEKRAEIRKAKAAGAAATANGDSTVVPINGLPDLELCPRSAAAFAMLVRAAQEASKVNDSNVSDILMRATARCNEVVAKAAAFAATRIAKREEDTTTAAVS